MTVVDLHILRVFTDTAGRRGNPLAVILDGGLVAVDRRQTVAAELALSETVFVDEPGTGVVRIFTPRVELPLAGHPLVGTAWLLARCGAQVSVLRPPAGEVPTWCEGDLTWIRGLPEQCPSFELRRLGTVDDVDAIALPAGEVLQICWAWEDERAGGIRARVFASKLGVAEDQATGSAALVLAAALARPLHIRQGRGSLIAARPGPAGTAEVGGRVALHQQLPYRLAP